MCYSGQRVIADRQTKWFVCFGIKQISIRHPHAMQRKIKNLTVVRRSLCSPAWSITSPPSWWFETYQIKCGRAPWQQCAGGSVVAAVCWWWPDDDWSHRARNSTPWVASPPPYWDPPWPQPDPEFCRWVSLYLHYLQVQLVCESQEQKGVYCQIFQDSVETSMQTRLLRIIVIFGISLALDSKEKDE